MHCPAWLFDIAVARVASEFLASEIELETFAKKYSEGLSELYSETPITMIAEPTMLLLQFLSEIEAGEMATELLDGYCYYRLMFESVSKPRRQKPLFGTLEDGAKVQEWSGEATFKGFKAYVFGLRSNTMPKAPMGWLLEECENIPKFAELAAKKLSILDVI